MSARSEADGSESICCDESFAPIRYHWYPATVGGASFLTEMRVLLESEAGMTKTLLDSFMGDVRARLRLLAQGRLRPVDQVKGPMESETRFKMFEVRYRFELGASDVMVRAYHVEPSAFRRQDGKGSLVVGLHIHKKIDEAAQDEEIKAAGRRFFDGRPAKWGVFRK